MRVRCAIFEGTVDGRTRRPSTFIADKVRRSGGLSKIRAAQVLRKSVEDNGPPVCQVFELQFDSAEDIAAALASPNRAKSRAALAEIMPLFKGRIYHVNLVLNERRP
jgi:hypothetical protein